MLRQRMSRIRERVEERLFEAFVAEHTPEEVAFSFSLGVFITALPTLGTGLLVFLILAYVFDRLSKVALFASVVLLNPVVKWGVYGASYSLGRLLLGPIPGASFEGVSLSTGLDVLARLWLGNLLLAAALAIVAYVAGLWVVNAFQRRARDGEVPLLDRSLDAVSADE